MKNLKIDESTHKRIKLCATFHEVALHDYAEAALTVAMRHEEEIIAELMLRSAKAEQQASGRK